MKQTLKDYGVNVKNVPLLCDNESAIKIAHNPVQHSKTKHIQIPTSGTCHFLGRSLVCWSSKKQNCVSLSTAEAEYIAAGSCCAQLLWMKQTLKDYGVNVKNVPLLCDNESAIKIAHNPVQHSKTKHIQIHHHFLCDHVLKGDISIEHVKTEEQLADIFTKPLDEKRFSKLRCELNILESLNVL